MHGPVGASQPAAANKRPLSPVALLATQPKRSALRNACATGRACVGSVAALPAVPTSEQDSDEAVLQAIEVAQLRVSRLSHEAESQAARFQIPTTQVIGDAWFGPLRIQVLPGSPAAAMSAAEIVAALDAAAAQDSSGEALATLLGQLAPRPPRVTYGA